MSDGDGIDLVAKQQTQLYESFLFFPTYRNRNCHRLYASIHDQCIVGIPGSMGNESLPSFTFHYCLDGRSNPERPL